MTNPAYPPFESKPGYLTATIQQKYILSAVQKKLLPENALRMADIVSLLAPQEHSKPIQFWQLYSVLGQARIVNIVSLFYQRVFNDENWFASVFERVGPIGHHINTQSAMWIDVMGGGPAYHGGEYRLSFHHTHNAMQLMNARGAERWVKLMRNTLDKSQKDLTDDPRVRASINTFLAHFMGKYAAEFEFENSYIFGETNPAYKRAINFLNMTSDAIEALSEAELKDALDARGVNTELLRTKQELVNKALSL